MSTVPQIKEILQRVLGPRADELARETGFVQRQRKLTGAGFAQGLVFACLAKEHPTGEEVKEMLTRKEVEISESGLSQHFSEPAATFLRRLLDELVAEPLSASQPAPVELFQPFDAVIVEDSTTIRLPESLQHVWAGCGGGQG